MNQREKLIELLESFQSEYPKSFDSLYYELAAEADYLLANGVVVLPCRCGECEYYNSDKEICGRQVCMSSHFNGFCDFAKRKGGDE